MGAVTGDFVGGNVVDLQGANVANGKTTYTDVYVDNQLSAGDLSHTFDDNPSDNGRFENGTIVIAGNVANGLLGNGAQRVKKTGGIDVTATPLPFTASDSQSPTPDTMSGTITSITKSQNGWMFKLNVTNHSGQNIPWAQFAAGGTISVGGGSQVVILNSFAAATSFEVATLILPYRLTDDDVTAGAISPPDTSLVATAFAPAYIVPKYDLQNNSNVTFVLNTDITNNNGAYVYDQTFNAGNDPSYWMIYTLSEYQGPTDSDNDPNDEGVVFGIANGIGLGAYGMGVFKESLRDFQANTNHNANCSEPATVAHEVGHIMGGQHPDGGLMAQCGAPRTSLQFTDQTLSVIRARVSIK